MKKFRVITRNFKTFWLKEKSWFFWRDVRVYVAPEPGTKIEFLQTVLKTFDSAEEAAEWAKKSRPVPKKDRILMEFEVE